MITILADRNIPFLNDYLPDGVVLKLFDPDAGLPESDPAIDALLVRTVTPIIRTSFNSRGYPGLKFVGTASAGIDHIDADYLDQIGIRFASAAGCNANAVGEYVATGILDWCLAKNLSPSELKVGVVGAGHTGNAVISILGEIGFKVIAHDPPRERWDTGFESVTAAEILGSDIITFHVPLVGKDSPEPTFHWLNSQNLGDSNARLVINAARGGVVEEKALLNAKKNGHNPDFILDVWENEPAPDKNTVLSSYLGTPHIAGYSRQSKRNGTEMIINELINYFGLDPIKVHHENAKEPVSVKDGSIIVPHDDSNEPGTAITGSINDLRTLHPMFELSRKLKSGISDQIDHNINLFRSLRTHSSLRDEYKYFKFHQKKMNAGQELIFKLLHHERN